MTSAELYVQTFLKDSEIAQVYVKGARIWVPDEEKVWVGAELLENYTGQSAIKIQIEDSAEERNYAIKDKKRLPHLRNPEILIGENDLTSLSYLNEPEVLYNLQVRFLERNCIYTYCGIVLVAINPYQQLPIYGNELIQMYSGQDMGTMDPHIFAVAEEAFKLMSRFDKNQSIIVSGESGAGKTVSAKYAMRYFAMVGGSQTETQVEQKVLASNPIMEAIGNAKTTRNDNSSRFGKYIEISFNKKNEIIGAHMRTYLLEKSRVVFQAAEERNYHIFYQLCASRDLPEFKKFCLLSPDDFYYTSHGMAPEIDGVDDAEDMLSAREALSMLGIAEKDQLMIFQIQAAVLHFGNVKIREADGESSEIKKDDKHLSIMCKLLGIEESQMRMWLCHKKIVTVGEVLTKPLTLTQASFAQDALAKHIYAQTFDWIVEKINRALHSGTKSTKFIGVLDIYGFETFEINSFEQFCINYANEKLQQIFNMHVFKLEQEEYVREAIEWSFIDFYDNQPCIDLIESKLGILDLLDEECKMPKGSDENWCQKLYDKHLGKARHFEKPRMSRSAFIINHFADRVEYQADGFLEKNRDTVLEDHINILRASEFELVAELFEEKVDPNEKKSRAGSATTHPMRQAPKGGRSNKKTVGSQQVQKATVGDQFRESLHKLMETLNATTPHYIRCIKPNDVKEAFIFEPKRAVEQLRACGVLETIRISAAGYPSRWTYPEFFQRYRVLAQSKDINRSDHKKTCENVLAKVIQGSVKKTPRGLEDPDKYRFGKTKIFFRAGQVAYLEKLRSDKLKACGIMIQKHVKGWLARRRYQRIIKSVSLLQKYGRGLLARRHAKFLRETHSATCIQKRWRGYKARIKYLQVRKATVVIQSAIRGYFGRMLFKQELHEHRAVTIQKMVRSYLARKRYKRVMRGIVLLQSHYRRRKAKKELKHLKIEAKSVEHIKNVNKGLENKIIQLQQKLDSKNKEGMTLKEQELYIKQLKGEIEKLRSSNEEGKKSSNKVSELMQQIKDLQEELSKEREDKQILITEKEELVKEHTQILSKLSEEKCHLKEELEEANLKLEQQEIKTDDELKIKLEEAKKVLQAEFDSERSHHQRLVKEHARLQQRLENLQSEMAVLTSPGGHKRTPSDISAISLESFTSSVSPDEVKYEEEGAEEKDQGYGTKKKKKAPAPPLPSATALEKEMKDVDIGLVLKLQNKVKELERQRTELEERVEHMEEETPRGGSSTAVISNSAFDALKQQLVNADDVQLVIKLQKRIAELEMTKSKLADELDEREDEEDEDRSGFKITTPEFAYNNLKMQELQNENDKLKREVSKLMKSISENVSFEKGGTNSPAGKEFMEQFTAMSDELERRREECLQLRAMLAEKSITTHAIAKESYGGVDDIVNEDNELALAYRTQKELNSHAENCIEEYPQYSERFIHMSDVCIMGGKESKESSHSKESEESNSRMEQLSKGEVPDSSWRDQPIPQDFPGENKDLSHETEPGIFVLNIEQERGRMRGSDSEREGPKGGEFRGDLEDVLETGVEGEGSQGREGVPRNRGVLESQELSSSVGSEHRETDGEDSSFRDPPNIAKVMCSESQQNHKHIKQVLDSNCESDDSILGHRHGNGHQISGLYHDNKDEMSRQNHEKGLLVSDYIEDSCVMCSNFGSKPDNVFKDNNNHTDSSCPCKTCSQEALNIATNQSVDSGLMLSTGESTVSFLTCDCNPPQSLTEKDKILEPVLRVSDEPDTCSNTCSQCGEKGSRLTSVFDELFCDKCHSELELEMSVALSLDSSASKRSPHLNRSPWSEVDPPLMLNQSGENLESNIENFPVDELDTKCHGLCSEVNKTCVDIRSKEESEVSNGFTSISDSETQRKLNGITKVDSETSMKSNGITSIDLENHQNLNECTRNYPKAPRKSNGFTNIHLETPQVIGSASGPVDHAMTNTQHLVNGNVDVHLDGHMIGHVDRYVNDYEDEDGDVFDDTVEASTVIQTSDDVRWEGSFMCTCEECLRGLRIERIVTADKSTMCPDTPPYVLMCEICEELLENQLQKTEKDAKKKEDRLKREIRDLKQENEAAQKAINQNLQLGPEAKIEATMQHEITRLTSENLDLREKADKQSDQIRKMKKMLKVYAKKLKEGDVAEIEAELERDDKQKRSDDGVATVKHLDRTYMGMLEYKKEDEPQLIKCLIMDLKPKVAQGFLPGLPSYILFMCVRHTDYINDDEKVRTLLTNTINGIKKCVKKHNKELDRVILWLANTCRLLHTLKQYSGEKAFQTENTPRQNEHCLRNFDLSEYRQVFSDLAVWIYQTLIKHMEEVLQPMVVPAILDHEAIAGLTASKPVGMRGRSSSTANPDEEVRELSLDSLMKALNKYNQILSQNAVDPELVKQVFRQLYYYIGSNALNNLLLRKDMCNWSKGMQIRYNLSHLEQWLRDNKLNESGAQDTLEPITQASQLLQARKSDADVDSICEMCSKLTTPQIVKILNLYTPVDEFEERVPISFIRKIQERLKSVKHDEDNTLLIDTKYSFPVTFPFNPSTITLDSIDIPESLHLDFLTRV